MPVLILRKIGIKELSSTFFFPTAYAVDSDLDLFFFGAYT